MWGFLCNVCLCVYNLLNKASTYNKKQGILHVKSLGEKFSTALPVSQNIMLYNQLKRS